jgi:hypothetical protein
LPKPIYIEHLSQYSYYKYAGLLLIGTVTGICYFILRYFFPNFRNNDLWLKITFPYLKEEVRIILYTWNESFFGNICSNIIDNVFKSKILLRLFVIIHIIFSYVIRFIQALLFINFAFFHGDLRWNLYLLPLSFISWVLRFFEYYLKIFFKGSCEYIRILLNVKPKKDYDNFSGIASITGDELDFSLTSLALQKGFKPKYLFILANEWLQLNHLEVLLIKYEKILYWFNLFIIILRILAWFYLSLNYFSINYTILSGSSLFFSKTPFIFRFAYIRSPLEAFKVRATYQNALEKETDGACGVGHLIIADFSIEDEKGRVLVEGGLTHGKGSTSNPSSPVHPTEDLNGTDPRGQRATFTKTPTFVDRKYFYSNPIPGSKDFLAKSESKVNIAKIKHDHKEEEYP